MQSLNISQITPASSTDVEFVCNNRLYVLLIDQEALDNTYGQEADYWESLETGKGYDTVESVISVRDWEKLPLTEADYLEVITANQASWEDVTEYTDKGAELLRKESRRKLLSMIVTQANKMYSSLRNMSLAMHVAWTRAKVLAKGLVSFVKVNDVDTEGEIPVHTRRIASLEGMGFVSSGEKRESNRDILKFIDLDKFDAWVASGLDKMAALKRSIISMHVWQVVE